MKPQKKSQTASPQSSARVVDGKLILSLPDAINPVVWQMNLNEVSASALKVEEKTDSKSKASSYVLLMSTGKNETTDIAAYATREEAVNALMAASAALENAQGTMPGRPPAGAAHPYYAPGYPAAHGRPTGKKKWLFLALTIVAFFVIVNIWAGLQPMPPQSMSGGDVSAQQSGIPPQEQSGVPLSADAFLQNQ